MRGIPLRWTRRSVKAGGFGARMDPVMCRSLTGARGMELAGHKLLTAVTGIEMFFAIPRGPWQRGANENTNKLLRQYLPKGTCLGDLIQQDLDSIATKLNNRPRERRPLPLGRGVHLRVLQLEEPATVRNRDTESFLAQDIRMFFELSHGTYGYRSIHADLRAAEIECSPELVRSIMREEDPVPTATVPCHHRLRFERGADSAGSVRT